MLCSLYAYYAWPAAASSASVVGEQAGKGVKGLGLGIVEGRNGHVIRGGIAGRRREEEGVRGAEEFELEGLITDEEEEDQDGEEDGLVAGKSRINGEATEGANGRISRKVNGRAE